MRSLVIATSSVIAACYLHPHSEKARVSVRFLTLSLHFLSRNHYFCYISLATLKVLVSALAPARANGRCT